LVFLRILTELLIIPGVAGIVAIEITTPNIGLMKSNIP